MHRSGGQDITLAADSATIAAHPRRPDSDIFAEHLEQRPGRVLADNLRSR